MGTIGTYTSEIPSELRRCISAINPDIGLAVFLVLYKHGRMKCSEIEIELSLSDNEVKWHLNSLQKASLVAYYSDNTYEVTNFGVRFFECIMSTLTVLREEKGR